MRRLAEVFVRRAAPVLLALLALAVHAQAAAHVSGSVAVVSDYLYRGISLSEGKAVPQLTLVYDNPDGWYLGGFASRVRIPLPKQSGPMYVSYAGYSRRLASGNSWEVGVSNYALPRASFMSFKEVYAGLASERFSGRLSYSPDYLAPGLRTVYAELSASQGLSDNLSLFAHVGYLGSLRLGPWTREPIRRADVRIGLGVSVQSLEVQLAWAGVYHRRAVGVTYGVRNENSDSVVLNVVRRF